MVDGVVDCLHHLLLPLPLLCYPLSHPTLPSPAAVVLAATAAAKENQSAAPAEAAKPVLRRPLPNARSRWKKLTGTAMFINRLGKKPPGDFFTSGWFCGSPDRLLIDFSPVPAIADFCFRYRGSFVEHKTTTAIIITIHLNLPDTTCALKRMQQDVFYSAEHFS